MWQFSLSLAKCGNSYLFIVAIRSKAREVEVQNNAARWSVKQQWAIELLSATLEILITVSQMSQLTNHLSPCCLLLCFLLSSLLHTSYRWTQCALQYILPSSMCLNSSCLPLLLGVYLFLNPHHIHHHSCHGTIRL